MTIHYEDDLVTLHHGDCVDALRTLPDCSVTAVVTDPPYEIGFSYKDWDSTGIAFSTEMWAECLRVLKPGGWCLAFGGTRTWHRLACAVEDSGFILRDQIAWIYRTGMPKGMDMGKIMEAYSRGLPASSGGIRQATKQDGGTLVLGEVGKRWEDTHTALKPAFEPIIMAQKPVDRSWAQNADRHGCGPLMIAPLRIKGTGSSIYRPRTMKAVFSKLVGDGACTIEELEDIAMSGAPMPNGRDSKKELQRLQEYLASSPTRGREDGRRFPMNVLVDDSLGLDGTQWSAFRYVAKPAASEQPRVGNLRHHTVKPLALMRWLITLVSPPGAVVLDPFAGSGTTLEAAMQRGVKSIGIEKEDVHLPLIMQRIERQHAAGDPILPPGDPRDFKAKKKTEPEQATDADTLPLFGDTPHEKETK
ncbi:DNA-methyltransferase [Corynebacterium neomassiliense]|uniref:DNA-methyltransferase n=1 Tax=Corynebacterium neomassiliense TaxID=2079482 RepID=UPI00102F3937|nr:site-specific DNA-methyltransferase [Corynebacterium neomassiliense]